MKEGETMSKQSEEFTEWFIDKRDSAARKFWVKDLHEIYHVPKGEYVMIKKEDYIDILEATRELGGLLVSHLGETPRWPYLMRGDYEAGKAYLMSLVKEQEETNELSEEEIENGK